MAAQAYFYAGSEKTIPKVRVLFFLETVFELENIELQISLALNDLAFHFLLLFFAGCYSNKISNSSSHERSLLV